MANAPMISVVVPMYKVEQYIKLCVDSILKQTFQDFEIILVDDASPDNCVDICRKLYGDNDKVKLVRHEKNLGLGPARNTGMKHARGKYICFVDSDDLILPNALEKFFIAAEKTDAQVVQAAGWYELLLEESSPVRQENLKTSWSKYSKEGFLKNNPVYRLDEYWDKYKLRSAAWFRFCRRDFIEAKKLEFLPIISEDETFAIALYCLTERYYIIHEALYVYRKRSGSIMRTHNAEKFSQSVRSIILGLKYTKSFLDNIPRFQNYEQWCRGIFYKFVTRFTKNHTYPNFKSATVDPEINNTAEKLFTEIFGDNAYFIKFFFLHYHTRRRQTEQLKKQKEVLEKEKQALLKKNARMKKISEVLIREQPALSELMNSVKSDAKRIFLMGTPNHGNLGDHAIVSGEMHVLKKFFPEHNLIEIPYDYLTGELGELLWGLGLQKHIRRDDIIFLHGGGNFGNLWINEENLRRSLIEKFAQNKIVIFPQSIHFTDDDNGRRELEVSQKIYNTHRDLHLMTRDENSFAFAKEFFPQANVYLLPDSATVLQGIVDDFDVERQGVLFVLRGDKEKVRDDADIQRLQNYLVEKNIPFEVTDTVIKERVTADNREQKIRDVLMKIRRSKLVVTDRFHGVIFSFVTRTPALAFKSFDTKISSGIKWFKDIPSIFYAQDEDWSSVENFINTYYFAAAEKKSSVALNPKIITDAEERFIRALNQIVRPNEISLAKSNPPPMHLNELTIANQAA